MSNISESSIAGFLIVTVDNMSAIEKQQYRAAIEIPDAGAPYNGPISSFGVLPASVTGTSLFFARGDHAHKILVAAPVSLGIANTEGTSTFLARADHVHQHGNLGGGSQHALVDYVDAGFMSAADKINLDGLVISGGVPTSRLLNTTAPLLIDGGASANLSADRTFSMPAATTLADGYMTSAFATLVTNAVPNTRSVIAGAGMTGGGTLAADRTFNIVANGDGSIVVNADDIQVGTLASDAQHGNLGGGTLHAVATILLDGFMSATDKIKLNGIATGATNTPLATVAPADVTKDAAVIGVSTEAAKADHKHDISTAAPVALGTANAEGSSTSLARADHVHISPLIQTTYDEIAVDTTTTSTTYVTLLSRNVTVTAGTKLLIRFSACSSLNTATDQTIFFRLTVDGVVRVTAGRFSTDNNAIIGTSINYVATGLAAGSRTVLLEWRTTGNTAQIRSATIEGESASLLVEEVTV